MPPTAWGLAAAKTVLNGHQGQRVDNGGRIDPSRERLINVGQWRQCPRSRSLSRKTTITGTDAHCARAALFRDREARPNRREASGSAEHRTPLQLMPIVSHSLIVSRERIATLIGLCIRMLGSRRTSLELAVRASGSRIFLVMLHVLSHFAMLPCRKVFAIWAHSVCRTSYLIVPVALDPADCRAGLFSRLTFGKKPGVQL